MRVRVTVNNRGCVKTQKWPRVLLANPSKIAGWAGRLLIERNQLQSQSVACHAELDIDFRRRSAVVFSHALDPLLGRLELLDLQ